MSGRSTAPRRGEGIDGAPHGRDEAIRPTRWEDGRPSSEAVARSLDRGSTLERLGCFREALLVYDEALAAPDDRRSALDAGRLIHRVGVCAIEVGDGARALASFLEAGRRAHDLGMPGRCGESLAAAGFGLVLHPVATPVDEAVDGALVKAAFDGVIEEARRVLSVDGTPDLEDATVLHDRFAGLTFLSTEALLHEAQSLAAENLHFDVLVPFSVVHDIPSKTEVDEPALIAFMTGALARLCRDLGEQGRQRRAGSPPTESAVAAMARFLEEAFYRDMREPIRRWLSAYLRDRRGADWATDAHLLTAGGGR